MPISKTNIDDLTQFLRSNKEYNKSFIQRLQKRLKLLSTKDNIADDVSEEDIKRLIKDDGKFVKLIINCIDKDLSSIRNVEKLTTVYQICQLLIDFLHKIDNQFNLNMVRMMLMQLYLQESRLCRDCPEVDENASSLITMYLNKAEKYHSQMVIDTKISKFFIDQTYIDFLIVKIDTLYQGDITSKVHQQLQNLEKKLLSVLCEFTDANTVLGNMRENIINGNQRVLQSCRWLARVSWLPITDFIGFTPKTASDTETQLLPQFQQLLLIPGVSDEHLQNIITIANRLLANQITIAGNSNGCADKKNELETLQQGINDGIKTFHEKKQLGKQCWCTFFTSLEKKTTIRNLPLLLVDEITAQLSVDDPMHIAYKQLNQ